MLLINSTPTANGFRVRGTKVYTSYPTQLTPGEVRLIHRLEKFFPPDQIYPDCYFPKPNREAITTVADLIQIDCLVISRQGLLVFESKDYSGWIYGHGERVRWTQVLNFGKEKHQFYNPIRQNQAHIAALRAALPDWAPIYSLIIFGVMADIKILTNVPENCFVGEQMQLDKLLRQIPATLSEAQTNRLATILDASRIIPDALVREEHIEEIKTLTRTEA